MNTRGIGKIVASLACVALLSSAALAQTPTSYADNSYQYNAYVYSYMSKVSANGLANALNGSSGEVAQIVSDYCDDAFFHCYDALMDDDDTQWAAAEDDLEMALFWCYTLEVFVSNSSSSVQHQVDTLMWNLEIAIANAASAKPVAKKKFTARTTILSGR